MLVCKNRLRILLFILLSVLFYCMPVNAAEYLGEDIDGELYSATAFSYSTGKFYYVDVEFSGSDAYIYFPKGGYIIVSLDDEEIDDPNNISAFDYKRGNFWDISIDNLD